MSFACTALILVCDCPPIVRRFAKSEDSQSRFRKVRLFDFHFFRFSRVHMTYQGAIFCLFWKALHAPSLFENARGFSIERTRVERFWKNMSFLESAVVGFWLLKLHVFEHFSTMCAAIVSLIVNMLRQDKEF